MILWTCLAKHFNVNYMNACEELEKRVSLYIFDIMLPCKVKFDIQGT